MRWQPVSVRALQGAALARFTSRHQAFPSSREATIPASEDSDMDSSAWLALQQLVTQEERGHCTAGSPALVRAARSVHRAQMAQRRPKLRSVNARSASSAAT